MISPWKGVRLWMMDCGQAQTLVWKCRECMELCLPFRVARDWFFHLLLPWALWFFHFPQQHWVSATAGDGHCGVSVLLLGFQHEGFWLKSLFPLLRVSLIAVFWVRKDLSPSISADLPGVRWGVFAVLALCLAVHEGCSQNFSEQVRQTLV